MSPEPITEAQAIVELARNVAIDPWAIEDPNVVYAVVVATPEGQRLGYVDREDLLPQPRRKAGVYLFGDLASLTTYISTHGNQDATSIWIDRGNACVIAVLNDHAGPPGIAGWGDHQAILRLERTPEWTHWKDKDGRLMGQEEFAEHVQQGVGEILDPDPATMLEVAQSIQGTSDATWRTARRLDNGEVGFTYTEDIQASAGRTGALEVPSTFTLKVAPFYGDEDRQLEARLRYRVNGGHLTIGYQLVQPHTLELQALTAMQVALTLAFPHVYMGYPRPRAA